MRVEEATRRLLKSGTQPDQATALAQRLNATVLASPYVASSAIVTEVFGVPTRATSAALIYELTLWPEHYYEWRVLNDGRVVTKGFVLRAQPVALPLPLDIANASGVFQLWHHTREDVERALGAPRKRSGWWPEDSLSYGPLHDGRDLVFVFNHGLLSMSRVEDPSDHGDHA